MARTKTLTAQERRSSMAFVTFTPLEHDALRKRAAQNGATISSTIRVLVLKELFQEANRKVGERKPITEDWPENAGR